MTDKEKITAILKAYTKKHNISASSVILEEYAEELLANGVIVPPCKVGDKVYYPYDYGNKVLEKTVKRIVIKNNDKWLDVGVGFLPFENIDKTAFLTKEEAEKALAERNEIL